MQRKSRKSDSASSSITANSTTSDSGILLSDAASENTSIGSPEAGLLVIEDPTGLPTSIKRSSSISECKSETPFVVRKARKTRKPRKEYVCSVCEKQFRGSSDLHKHARTHTGERPYGCDKCPMRFKQTVSLKNHIASIHGTDQKFSCDQCKKSFPLKERLRLHMRIHSGEKPYSCSQCPKTFARGGPVSNELVIYLRSLWNRLP